MVDNRLQNYITANLNNNVSVEKIREALLAAGWQESLVTDALKSHTIPTMKLKAVESSSAKLAWGIVIFLVILIIVVVVGFVVYNKEAKDPNTKNSLSTQLLINEIQDVNENFNLNNCKDDIGCLLKGIADGRAVYGVPSLKNGEKLSISVDTFELNTLTVELQELTKMAEGSCISDIDVFSIFLNTWKKTSGDALNTLKENADCKGQLFDDLKIQEEEEIVVEEGSVNRHGDMKEKIEEQVEEQEEIVEDIVEEVIEEDIIEE
jgi:hypothetical protein